MMKRVIILLLVVMSSNAVVAQQEAMISQYMFNELYINPAYAGSHEYFDISGLYRTQWVDFDGAPVTQLFNFEGPLMNRKLGIGLNLVNDDIGDTHQFEVNGNFAYHFDFDKQQKNRLSIGIRAGVSNYTARLTETAVIDQSDPVFNRNIEGEWIPKFGAGIYYYGENKYAGISIPNLYTADDPLRLNVDSINYEDEFYFENHVFANAGIIFPISNTVKLKPNVLVKYQQAAPIEVDISANFLIREILWLGGSYRTDDAVVGMVEVNITPQLRLGYAYDFTITEIADYSSGSHEVLLGYRLGKDVIKSKSPRYF